jgi:UDP-2-acetamido-2,6-beta-L-arabino-hexul-4-ose reductase
MKILITGSNGFIGLNLHRYLEGFGGVFSIDTYVRSDSREALISKIRCADFVVHLAGENRPNDEAEFYNVNCLLTKFICDCAISLGKKLPIIFTSSVQAEQDNPYGVSKIAAEKILEQYSKDNSSPVIIYRLPGVFGKWAKPNYNSVVATFCYNIARELPISIHDSSAIINLIYIDDLLSSIKNTLQTELHHNVCFLSINTQYHISLGELALQIKDFEVSRKKLMVGSVGQGLSRALYATYVSYLPADKFSYCLPFYGDNRGIFAEFIKTPTSGQFSFFTAAPNITRGEHFHHTKTEKFLVVKGSAKFRFRQINSGEILEFITSSLHPEIIETIPGWAHSITNIGDDELIAFLWANEIFDRANPDTIGSKA